MLEEIKETVEELHLKLGDVKSKIGDSRRVELPDSSVDGIITSPPYSTALDYVKNDAHSLKDMGYDLDKIKENFIGVRGKGKDKIELYNDDMRKSHGEMYRVLKPNKYAVIIIGNATYQTQEIKTVEFTVHYMTELGFELERNIPKLIFGLYNVIKKENILVFKKTKDSLAQVV